MSGIGEEMGDVGLAIQRAEDKTAQMQARGQAIDELIASGALDDASQLNAGDDISRELDALSSTSDVEAELARLKAGSAPPQAIEASEGGDILAEQPEAVRAEGESTEGGRA
jgi:phage shock protein A